MSSSLMFRQAPNLTLFYDSSCPLCAREMEALARLNAENKLAFEDIHAKDFTLRYPEIDPRKASAIFHGRCQGGEMIYGLDVSIRAWNLLGKMKWLKLLRLPIVRIFSDLGYRFFARYRSQISFALTGKSKCSECDLKKHTTRVNDAVN